MIDIAAMRKKKGWDRHDFAHEANADYSTVWRWETTQAAKGALPGPIYRLIELLDKHGKPSRSKPQDKGRKE